MDGLSFAALLRYNTSSYRAFEAHEHHITRRSSQSVLVMVYAGTLRFAEEGIEVEVAAGEYYIQRPGLLQTGTRESDRPQYYYIHFDGGTYGGEGADLPLHGTFDAAGLFPLFDRLETLQLTGASLVEKSAVFYRILAALKNGAAGRQSEILKRVLSALAAHPQKPFSLDDMARECGYSKNHIISIFKAEMGKTPHAYVQEVRLEKAKQLMLTSQSSLAGISAECGFGAYINLYRAFLRAEGCSPEQWRERNLSL